MAGSALVDLQHREKSFLRDLDAADFFHPLFAFFLFFEQLAFARDVAAVAFGDDVFAHGFDGFAGDDLAADSGLDGDLEHLPRDEFLHLRGQQTAFRGGGVGVKDKRKGIDRLAGDEDVELYELAFLIARQMIIERGIALGNRSSDGRKNRERSR